METVISVTDQCVDPDAIMYPYLQIEWEELLGEPVYLGSEQYAGIFSTARPPYQ